MSGTRSRKKEIKAKVEKVFIRMSPRELIEAKKNAEKYSRGNLSRWMRDRASRPMLDISIRMQNEIDGGFDEE